MHTGYTYEKDADGTTTGTFKAVQAVTLDQCKTRCADGTWLGCVGFSRYMNKDDELSTCWWVTKVSRLSTDDGNDNEDMYKLIRGPTTAHYALRMLTRLSNKVGPCS